MLQEASYGKNQRTFGPSMHAPKKKTVFEPTEIQTITLYLTVSSFTTVVFLIELELLTPVWLTFTVSALSVMHVNFVEFLSACCVIH